MGILTALFRKVFLASHPANHTDPALAAPSAAPGNAAPVASEATHPPVDLEAALTRLQASHPRALDWRTSIVDLLELVGLDSGVESRTALARELHYADDSGDRSATDRWLHAEVMRRVAENGGQVPTALH